MKKITFILSLSIVMLALNSCADPEASALLTDGAWNFKNLTTNSEDEAIITLVNVIKIAHTDATLEFQSGGDYIKEYLVGDAETGSWELIGEVQLILTADEELPIPSTIESLTDSKLSYIQSYVDEQLNSYSVTFTWDR